MASDTVTSLIITRKTVNYWQCLSNLSSQIVSESLFAGTQTGDFLTIKSFNGAIVYHQVYYGYISYYDEVQPENNMITPANPSELFAHLKSVGFFVNSSNGGGGTGGVTTFKQLLDVNSPGGFIGRRGQVYVVAENEQDLIAVPLSNVRGIQDLEDYVGNVNLPPSEYFVTSSEVDSGGNSIGFTTAPIGNIVNRPALYNEPKNIRKGYTFAEGVYVWNRQEYSNEVGDWFEVQILDTDNIVRLYIGRWNGGAIDDPESFTSNLILQAAFAGEPGYEEPITD